MAYLNKHPQYFLHKCRATQELRFNYLVFMAEGDGLFNMSRTASPERERERDKPLAEMTKLLQNVSMAAVLNR